MSSPLLRAALLLAAAEFLSGQQVSPDAFTVSVEYDDDEYRLRCRKWPPAQNGAPGKHPLANPTTPPPPTVAHDVAWFSPLEKKIINGLVGKDWMVTADLAAAIGEEPNTEFRILVRNLEARGALQTCNRRGVRLKPIGGEAKTDE